ncbi:MAG: carboxypeptidase regulatory-like domain-containing protein, partial [bacterium]
YQTPLPYITVYWTGSINQADTDGFIVETGGLDHYEVKEPTEAEAGTIFTITITGHDAYCNPRPGNTGVTLTAYTSSTTAGSGILSSATYGTPPAGINASLLTETAISDLKYTKTENIKIKATDGTGKTVIWDHTGYNFIQINPAPLGGFELDSISNQKAGTSFTITVVAKDIEGNIKTNYFGTPTLKDDTGTLTPTAISGFVSGVASTQVTITKTATGISITAEDAGKTGTSNTFNIGPGPIDHFEVKGIPSPIQAGTPSGLTVTAYDKYNNVKTDYQGTIEFSTSDTGPQTTYPASYEFKLADQGQKVFDPINPEERIVLTKTGIHWVKVTDPVPEPDAIGQQTGIQVTPADLNYFILSTISNQTAGQSFELTITAYDQYNNPKTDYNNPATLSSTLSTADSPTPTALSFNSGIWAGSVTVYKSGTQKLTITDGVSRESNEFTVKSGTYTKLQIIQPGQQAMPGTSAGITGTTLSQAAGIEFKITINAIDNWANIIKYIGPETPENENNYTVRIRRLDPTKEGIFPEGQLSYGSTVLTMTAYTTGIWQAGSFEAMDMVTAKVGYNSEFEVSPGNPTKLLILAPGESLAPGTQNGKSSLPNSQIASQQFNLTIYATDDYYNLVTLPSSQALTVTSTDTQASIPAGLSLPVSGELSFEVTLRTVGAQTITAQDVSGTEPNLSSTAVGINVIPGDLDHFRFNTTIGNQVAGLPFNLSITAEDSGNNPVTEFDGLPVKLTTNLPGGGYIYVVSTGNQWTSDFVNGNWSGQVYITRAQNNVTITASDNASPEHTGDSNSFNLNAGSFTKLQILVPGESANPGTVSGKSGFPSNQTVNIASSKITVNAVDDWYNLVDSINGHNITVSSSDLNALFNPASGTLTNGFFSFNSATFKTNGYQTIRATDTNNGYSNTPPDPEILVLGPNLSSSTKVGSDLNGGNLLPGDTTEFTIEVYNTGNVEATGVKVTDTVPANVNLVVGSITGGGSEKGGVITWNIGDLGIGSTILTFRVTISAIAQNGELITNTASISSNEGVSANPSCQMTVSIPSALDHIIIRDAANGGGNVINDRTMTVGDTLILYAAGYDSGNSFIGDQSVTWSITGTASAATISPASGTATTLTANSSGSVQVMADDGLGHTDSTGIITIQTGGGPPPPPPTFTTLVITPTAVSLTTGTSQQFSAKCYDQNGAEMTCPSITWSVVNGGGTIDSAGLFTAGDTPGTYQNTIKAEASGKTAYATVIVTALPSVLTSLEVSPTSVTLNVASSFQLTAKGFDQYGQEMKNIALVWEMIDQKAGIIDQTGLFKAGIKVGFYQKAIKVRSGKANGVSFALAALLSEAYVDVTLTPEELDHLEISPTSVTLSANATQQFSVKAYDQYNNEITGLSYIWSIINGGGTINQNGLFTAGSIAGTYSNTVKVEAQAKAAYATVIVEKEEVPEGEEAVLTTLSISPSSVTLTIGASQQFIAKGYDQFGAEMTGLSFTWEIVNGGGTIDQTGLFTAGDIVGTYEGTVKVTSFDKSAFATVIIIEKEELPKEEIITPPAEEEIIIAPPSEIPVAEGMGEKVAEKVGEVTEKVAEKTKEFIAAPVKTTTKAATKAVEAVKKIRENPAVQKVNKRVITPVTTSGAAVGLLPLLPYLGLLNILQFLQLLFNSLLSFFGINRRKPWGMIYDSRTKKPISLAIVRMFSKSTHRLIETRVTDRKGRLGFLVQPGTYYLTVTKPNYVFPSQIAKGRTNGEYKDIYHGEDIIIQSKEDIIRVNIPLDSIARWKEQGKKGIWQAIRYFLRRINTPLLIAGTILALIAVSITPNIYNLLILLAYLFLLYFKRLVVKEERKPWGKVYDAQTKNPLALAIVKIYKKGYAVPRETQVTDHTGRFGFMPEIGDYYLVVEKEGYQTWRSEEIKVGKGGFVAVDVVMQVSR